MMAKEIDWYERRDELEPGQIFTDYLGYTVKLDRRVPSDGTAWYVQNLAGGVWFADDSTIEPGDLIARREDLEAA
jgi:hypothetical protein